MDSSGKVEETYSPEVVCHGRVNGTGEDSDAKTSGKAKTSDSQRTIVTPTRGHTSRSHKHGSAIDQLPPQPAEFERRDLRLDYDVVLGRAGSDGGLYGYILIEWAGRYECAAHNEKRTVANDAIRMMVSQGIRFFRQVKSTPSPKYIFEPATSMTIQKRVLRGLRNAVLERLAHLSDQQKEDRSQFIEEQRIQAKLSQKLNRLASKHLSSSNETTKPAYLSRDRSAPSPPDASASIPFLDIALPVSPAKIPRPTLASNRLVSKDLTSSNEITKPSKLPNVLLSAQRPSAVRNTAMSVPFLDVPLPNSANEVHHEAIRPPQAPHAQVSSTTEDHMNLPKASPIPSEINVETTINSDEKYLNGAPVSVSPNILSDYEPFMLPHQGNSSSAPFGTIECSPKPTELHPGVSCDFSLLFEDEDSPYTENCTELQPDALLRQSSIYSIETQNEWLSSANFLASTSGSSSSGRRYSFGDEGSLSPLKAFRVDCHDNNIMRNEISKITEECKMPAIAAFSRVAEANDKPKLPLLAPRPPPTTGGGLGAAWTPTAGAGQSTYQSPSQMSCNHSSHLPSKMPRSENPLQNYTTMTESYRQSMNLRMQLELMYSAIAASEAKSTYWENRNNTLWSQLVACDILPKPSRVDESSSSDVARAPSSDTEKPLKKRARRSAKSKYCPKA